MLLFSSILHSDAALQSAMGPEVPVMAYELPLEPYLEDELLPCAFLPQPWYFTYFFR